MSLKQALLVGAALALPVAAQAQPVTGFYVGAGAGINFMQETDVSLSGSGVAALPSASRSGTLDTNLGFAGVVSLGWGYGNGIRAEAEFSFRQNSVDTISGFANPNAGSASGDIRSYGFMLNALYDFDIGLPIFPYLGLGAGIVHHDYVTVRQRQTTGPANSVSIPGSDWVFGYQAIVGAAMPLNEVTPGLSLTAEYRFMGTLSPEVEAGRRVGNTGGPATAEVDNFNHSLLLGLRYAFNAAPPPAVVAPAPAAAPAPARTFLVFFDFDRADLTDRARAIIAEAATNAGRVGTTRIEVAGHADRAGTPQYNQALSERRAQAVAAELERRGIARSAMSIQAFGESRPLVPTADGVREPQNRRVEIVLR